ncbi:MAG: DMT family transporter, partial [Desulfobulbaceae bacterium]|nr:DMT family transporter [Desulfobulbaceae bacterium]
MPRKDLPAVLAALVGATIWGLVWMPLARLTDLGVTGLWTTFLVFGLIGSSGVIPVLVSNRRGRCPLRLKPALLLIIFGGLTNLLFFVALTETTVVRALMLFYLSPIWNLLGGRLIGKGRITSRKLLMIGISLAGAFILLGFHRNAGPSWNLGDSCALLSGIAFAISVVGLQLSPNTPSWALTVIHWLGAAITALIGILLFNPQPPDWGNLHLWLPLLLFFAVGMQGAASLAILFSLTKLESYRVNILMLFEIVVGSLSFAILSGKTVATHEWLGIMLILTASLIDNLRHSFPPA